MARPGDAGKAEADDSGATPLPETPMSNLPRLPRALVAPLRTRALGHALAVLLSAAPLGAGAAGCWIDEVPAKTADQLPVGAPAAAPLARLAREINAVLHRHPALAALPDGPTPVRLRTRWSIGYPHPELGRRSLWLQLRDHRPELWAGACGLSVHADRVEPRASVVVHVDAPEQLLERRAIDDDQLTAWPEPPLTGHAGPHPVYAGAMVVLSANGQLPWQPVTMDEYLRFHERELQRGAEAAAQSRREVERHDDGAMDRQMRAIYENMKKIDPAAAEQTLAALRAQMPAARAAAQRDVDRGERLSSDRLEALRAFRASLSAAVLQGPARLGWTEPRAPELLERMPRLVKIDPAWAGDRDPRQAGPGVRVIGLKIQGREPFEAPMRQVLQTLDYAALAALLAPAPRR
jgi:hypothetical protein